MRTATLRATLALALALALAYAGAGIVRTQAQAMQATQAHALACDEPVQPARNRAEVVAMLRHCY